VHSSPQQTGASETHTAASHAPQNIDRQNQIFVEGGTVNVDNSEHQSNLPDQKAASTVTPSAPLASSIHDNPREGNPLQLFSEKYNKVETSLREVEKAYVEAEATYETAKSRAAGAHKSLNDFDTKVRNQFANILTLNRNAGEDWTFKAIRSQASALRDFAMDKRRELLATQVPILEEEEAQMRYEETKLDYEKWAKKMEEVKQAVYRFQVY
jgi:hypothetical protein